MEDTFKKLDKLEDQYKIGKLQLHELVNIAYSMGVNDRTDSVVKESDSLPCVSNRFSESEIKMYRKQGRLSGAVKDKAFYTRIAELFEKNYDSTDFTILYDC